MHEYKHLKCDLYIMRVANTLLTTSALNANERTRIPPYAQSRCKSTFFSFQDKIYSQKIEASYSSDTQTYSMRVTYALLTTSALQMRINGELQMRMNEQTTLFSYQATD